MDHTLALYFVITAFVTTVGQPAILAVFRVGQGGAVPNDSHLA